MHVMQRKKPELFKILYTKYYPFKVVKLKVQDKYISRIRSNPDTTYLPDNDRVLKPRKDIITYALTGEKTLRTLGVVLYAAINCEYDSKNTYKTTDDITSIDNIPEFNEFFNLRNNHVIL